MKMAVQGKQAACAPDLSSGTTGLLSRNRPRRGHRCRYPIQGLWADPQLLKLLLAMRADVIHSLLNRRDLLGFFVGNFGFEFVFERHHELDHVERIGTEVVKKRR